jgi:outer membrane protein OmpA-like peptidoglycan-associated protein
MRNWTLGLAITTLAFGASAATAKAFTGESDVTAKTGKVSNAHRMLAIDDEETIDAGSVEAAPDVAGQYNLSGLLDASSLSTASTASAHHRRPLRIPVATAYAAPLTASQDTCMGSRTFGIQAMGFGISFATTWQDVSCRRIHNARALDAMGYHGAAIALLCMDEEVHDAMDRAGTPCLQAARAHFEPPPPEPQPEITPPPLATYSVLFDFDKSNLRPEADAILAPLLATLRADPNLAVDIEGHTDWVGSDAYNLRLSQRRAQAVVEWLIAHGIARERLQAVGKGESQPVATNQTAAGRQLNRRVEIRRHGAP